MGARPKPPGATSGFRMPDSRVTAVLGPTNTGKTHLAIERMLGHRSGVIGLPLRLLAREVYDRIAAARGAGAVALITGEEKIVPEGAAYFVCTTESMPLDRPFEFAAIDEVQLAADPERGHVFTDRLLHTRGLRETMFLGSATARALIAKLAPEGSFERRPRLSRLTSAGHRKLSRIPRRSAIVAFSAEDVYAVAETVRRLRGGAAVVLGALSPRTRNAQVEMFESGEVDYLVATDAIGMGLNLKVDHVAFAARRKFDGVRPRDLTPQEVAQIAGRAGRHLADGTFGTTTGCPELDAETIERVENHRFEAARRFFWRNSELSFSSPEALLDSLDQPPPAHRRRNLMRPRRAVDRDAFESLYRPLAVRSPEQVRLLWEVCQIPDYRKTLTESHARLLSSVYGFLASPDGVLAVDWLADRIARLDRTDGDIDTLAARIAHVRTWTYVCHHGNWVPDARHWQERARDVEDRLSDALHERLTQRFVDRRSAALSRLGERGELDPTVDAAGEVSLNGHVIGRLAGFRFAADAAVTATEQRRLRAAAQRTLRGHARDRAGVLAQSDDTAFAIDGDEIFWRGAPVARLARGPAAGRPRAALLSSDLLDGTAAARAEARLNTWLGAHVDRALAPLRDLERPGLSAPARGLAFQIAEGMGAVARATVEAQIGALSAADRKELSRRGVRLGALAAWMPAMSRNGRPELCARLWALFHGARPPRELPGAGDSPAAEAAVPKDLYLAAGAIVLGGRVVPIERAERLTNALYRRAAKGPVAPDADLAALAGGGGGVFEAVAAALGFARRDGGDNRLVPIHRAGRQHGGKRRKPPPTDRRSPFAALARHPLGHAGR